MKEILVFADHSHEWWWSMFENDVDIANAGHGYPSYGDALMGVCNVTDLPVITLVGDTGTISDQHGRSVPIKVEFP